MLAGGASSRFGSDKALALVDGKPLIAHVVDALAGQSATVVVCGRAWGNLLQLDDVPHGGLGPMAGLAAALAHAQANGFEAVLCAPCDILGLPADLADMLAPGPSVTRDQWLIGLWPAALAGVLAELLHAEGAISARRWAQLSAARTVTLPPVRNINLPDDLC